MSALNQKLDRAFNLTSLQILRIDREGMIDDIISDDIIIIIMRSLILCESTC